MNESTRTIAKNISALFVSQLTTWGLTLLLTIFLPRYLGPAHVGKLFLALSIWAIMVVVAGFGMDIFSTKEIARRPELAPRMIGQSLVARCFMFLLCAVAVAGYVVALDYPFELVVVVAIIGISSLFDLLGRVFIAGFSGHEQMGFVSIGSVINRLVYTVLAFVMMYLGQGINQIALVHMFGSASSLAILTLFYVRRHDVELSFNPGELLRLLRVSAPYLMSSLIVVAYNEVDKQIIAALLDERAVGYYATAATLFSTVMFIPVVFSAALFPMMARSYSSSPDMLVTMNRKSLDLMFIVGIPVSLGIMAIARPLVELVYGPEFAPAGAILSVLAVSIVFVYQNILISQILTSSERVGSWVIVMVVATIVRIILHIILVPWCQRVFGNGALAGAVIYLVVEAGQTTAGILMMRKGTITWNNVGTAVRALIIGLAMTAVCFLTIEMFILVPITLGAATYVALILLFRVLPAEDLQIIRQLATQLLGRLRPRRDPVSVS
jgi:O-antigen/teichoic acid export membrane protein